jgi:putative Holliday junction resolvase
MQHRSTVLALDVGAQRIGVARALLVTRFAAPLTTLTHTADIYDVVGKLAKEEDAGVLVVGLPRGLEGQHTAQTRSVEEFAEGLKQALGLPLYYQDEAVTSAQAEAELQARKKPYVKGDIDALAATYILEDFLRDHPEVKA